jgi:hypothetical protein
VGDLLALADAAHVAARPVWQWAPLSVLLLTTQDDSVHGDTHDDVPMEPIMYGRLTTAMIRVVSRPPSGHDRDDGDNEPMWSLEWGRLNAIYGTRALAEFESLINTALAMLFPTRPTVARAGCVAEAKSNNEHIARSLDGLPSLIPLCHTNIFPKL